MTQTLTQEVINEALEVMKSGPVDAEFLAKAHPLADEDVNATYPTRVQLNAYWAFKRTAPQPGGAWCEGAVTFINRIIAELGADTTVKEAISYLGAGSIAHVPEDKRSQTVREIYELATETRISYVLAAEDLINDCLRDFTSNGPHGKPRIAVTPVTTHDPSTVLEIAEYLSEKPGLRFLD